ncbi:MAG: CHAP domain-containing protein [Candidatus Sericytochromatia bacterium]
MGNISTPSSRSNPPLPVSTSSPAPALPQTTPPVTGVPKPPVTTPTDAVSAPPPAGTATPLNFVDSGPSGLPAQIAEIQKQADPQQRAEAYEELLGELTESADFDGALSLFKASQNDSLLPTSARSSLYKALTQELLEASLYDKAIELNNTQLDIPLKEAVRSDIVDHLIEVGQTFKAAEVRGEGNLTGVARAELDRMGNTVRTLGQDAYELWRRSVIGMSLGERIADNARDDAEAARSYRQPWLDYGNKACAYAVSRIFDRTRLDTSVDSAECNALSRQLEQSGFDLIAGGRSGRSITTPVSYKEGDVVFFKRGKKAGFGHVGVISKIENGRVYMVHNSSSRRQVVQIPLDNYTKPVAVFRAPE